MGLRIFNICFPIAFSFSVLFIGLTFCQYFLNIGNFYERSECLIY